MTEGGPARVGRIGVFGGSFDPPHVGHLIAARDAAERLGLERVLLVVAARPPHKPEGSGTSADLRLEMVTAAVQDDPVLTPSDLELRRGGTSFTVDTLRELRQTHPAAQLSLIIGADQWRDLARWKEPEELGRLATIVVLARSGEDPASSDHGLRLSFTAVPVSRIDVSSTEVRARVRAGRSIRDLVPEAVRTIIEREALYRAPAVHAVGGR